MKFLLQSLILALSFAAVFIWQQTPLSGYTIQALGFLVLLYLLTSFRRKFNPLGEGNLWTILILNALIFLLVFSTGVINSPLFFLLYFLGFGIAFIFEPGTVFVFVIGAILVMLPQILSDDVVTNAVKVGSLGLISPLAFFFGREFRDREKAEEKAEAVAADITENVEEVIQSEETVLSEDDIKRLTDILGEVEELEAK